MQLATDSQEAAGLILSLTQAGIRFHRNVTSCLCCDAASQAKPAADSLAHLAFCCLQHIILLLICTASSLDPASREETRLPSRLLFASHLVGSRVLLSRAAVSFSLSLACTLPRESGESCIHYLLLLFPNLNLGISGDTMTAAGRL